MLDADQIRPMVIAMVARNSPSDQAEDCATIDHMVTALAPLPPANSAEAIVRGRDRWTRAMPPRARSEDLPICPVAGSPMTWTRFSHAELVAAARRVVEENRCSAANRVAESCTGGLVAAALTEIAGSSEVSRVGLRDLFERGQASTCSKRQQDVLETFGAVSIALPGRWRRARSSASHADVAVAITGVAGPGGGTEKKPVGTVVFARAEAGGDPTERASPIARISATSAAAASPSGGAVRARTAVAAAGDAPRRKAGRAILERADHLAQRRAEHLPGEHLEHPVLEREIDAEIDLAAAVRRGPEDPDIVEIFERPVEIIDMDVLGPHLARPSR